MLHNFDMQNKNYSRDLFRQLDRSSFFKIKGFDDELKYVLYVIQIVRKFVNKIYQLDNCN